MDYLCIRQRVKVIFGDIGDKMLELIRVLMTTPLTWFFILVFFLLVPLLYLRRKRDMNGIFVFSIGVLLVSMFTFYSSQIVYDPIENPHIISVNNVFGCYGNYIGFNVTSNISVSPTLNKTHSMYPLIDKSGSIIQMDDMSNLKIGNIVVYNSTKGEQIVHRIIGIDKEHNCYWIKGDDNLFNDGCIPKNRILYKVIGVIFTGD